MIEVIHYEVQKRMIISNNEEWWCDTGSYPGSYMHALLKTLEQAHDRAEEIKGANKDAKVRINKVVTQTELVQEY